MKSAQNKIFKGLITVALIALATMSCKEEPLNEVPNVYVYFRLNILTDAELFALRTQNNAMLITNTMVGQSSLGYDNNGIIVFNAGGGDFYAFDATCPHDLPKSVATELTSNNVATCPQCNSNYILPSLGVPSLDSPSKSALREYRATYNPNSGELVVHN